MRISYAGMLRIHHQRHRILRVCAVWTRLVIKTGIGMATLWELAQPLYTLDMRDHKGTITAEKACTRQYMRRNACVHLPLVLLLLVLDFNAPVYHSMMKMTMTSRTNTMTAMMTFFCKMPRRGWENGQRTPHLHFAYHHDIDNLEIEQEIKQQR